MGGEGDALDPSAPPALPEADSAGETSPAPPSARRIPVRLETHGDVRTDDYFWLREKSDPEVIAYLEAENRYTEAMMAPALPLRDALYAEIIGHIRETDVSVPFFENGWLYYSPMLRRK
jgi:oligopeptidase B